MSTFQVSFIFKVFALSAGIAVLIKYVAPALPIAANFTNALMAIALPSLILAILLFWRTRKNQQPD